MIPAYIWLMKMLLSHLVTDFILQPKRWVHQRYLKHFAAPSLYLHGLITAAFAWLLTEFQYPGVAFIIFLTHVLIDGWKSFQQPNARYFLIDQLLHLSVISGCWYFLFTDWNSVVVVWRSISENLLFWKIAAAFIFITTPSGILIAQITLKWREQIENAASLSSAGKWIGIIERIIIFVFVLQAQYLAIGLLVAAKGIIRFNEKDRPEVKTEYLVIGTLTSIGLAIGAGLLVKL